MSTPQRSGRWPCPAPPTRQGSHIGAGATGPGVAQFSQIRSEVVDDPQETIICLENALTLKPKGLFMRLKLIGLERQLAQQAVPLNWSTEVASPVG